MQDFVTCTVREVFIGFDIGIIIYCIMFLGRLYKEYR